MKLIIQIQQKLLYKPLKKLNNGKITLIVQNNRNKIKFYDNITFPHLNGSIFLGTITGIDKNIKAAFVKFGNYSGILSFFSIHPDYLGEAGQRIKMNIKKESPSALRKSNIYNKIDFTKHLTIGQKVLVQVINVDTNKVKLSTFISIYANGVKYNPNSLSPLIICNNKAIKIYVQLLKVPGSIITNLFTNKNNFIKIFERLVAKWYFIKNQYEYMKKINKTGLIVSGDPVDMILNKFNISNALCTKRPYIISLNHIYNIHIKYISNQDFEDQYSSQLLSFSQNFIKNDAMELTFCHSSTGTEILTNIDHKSTPAHVQNCLYFIIEHINVRNIGGLIFIPILSSLAKKFHYIFTKAFKRDASYIYSHMFVYPQNITIFLISKKYRYHLTKPYKALTESPEDMIKLDCGSFIMIYKREEGGPQYNIHIDINRGKSKKTNHEINISSMEFLIELIKLEKYKNLIYIDLLEVTDEEMTFYTQPFTEQKNISFKAFPLSVLILYIA